MNCWFCNSNTKVPYDQRNSFNCPSCTQYNGFNSDGDYNREIVEQHYSKMNTSNSRLCQKTDVRLPTVNGLCEGCNRNQEIKVIQLANFKPRIESKWEEEIEDYRKKLEDSYQLCQQCQRHLNKTLNRIKMKFIGSKISQLVTKGIRIVTASKASPSDRQVFSKIAMLCSFILALYNLLNDWNIDLDFMRLFSNESLTNIYYHIVALRLTIADLTLSWVNEAFLASLKDLNTDSIATTAVLLNVYVLVKNQQVRVPVVASMFLWSLKMVMSEIAIDPSYIFTVKTMIATALVITSIAALIKAKKGKTLADQNGSFHKIHSEIIDDSDTENELSDSIYDARTITSTTSMYSPSLTTFNSCLRDSTLVQPANTFPTLSKLNSSNYNKSLHNSTLGRRDAQSTCTMDLLSNRSFSIRQEVAAADRSQVHKEINNLNISGNLFNSTSTLKDFNVSKNLNPFSLDNSRCGSPTPTIASVFSGSQRAQIISPPRLEPTFMGETTSSWVAGGYWSSPQKRYLEANHFTSQIMSRSSSQSSGLGTIESGKNSRENSIGHEDVTSIFSEPVRRRNLFEKPQGARSLYSQSFVQAPRVNNFFNNDNTANFRNYRNNNSFCK